MSKIQIITPKQKCVKCNKLQTNFNFDEICLWNSGNPHNWVKIE